MVALHHATMLVHQCNQVHDTSRCPTAALHTPHLQQHMLLITPAIQTGDNQSRISATSQDTPHQSQDRKHLGGKPAAVLLRNCSTRIWYTHGNLQSAAGPQQAPRGILASCTKSSETCVQQAKVHKQHTQSPPPLDSIQYKPKTSLVM